MVARLVSQDVRAVVAGGGVGDFWQAQSCDGAELEQTVGMLAVPA